MAQEPSSAAKSAYYIAKDEYSTAAQDLTGAAWLAGFTGTASIAMIVAWTAERILTSQIPILGWVTLALTAAALLNLARVYFLSFRPARNALMEAKKRVRRDCLEREWPTNFCDEIK